MKVSARQDIGWSQENENKGEERSLINDTEKENEKSALIPPGPAKNVVSHLDAGPKGKI